MTTAFYKLTLKTPSLKIWTKWGKIFKICPIPPNLEDVLSILIVFPPCPTPLPPPPQTCESPRRSSRNPWLRRGGVGTEAEEQPLCTQHSSTFRTLSMAVEEFFYDALFDGLASSALNLAPGRQLTCIFELAESRVLCNVFVLPYSGALSCFLLWNAIGSYSSFCPWPLLFSSWHGGTLFCTIVFWLL